MQQKTPPPVRQRPMGTGSRLYTFEANKEIISPQPYTNGLAIPVNRQKHLLRHYAGSMEGWSEKSTIRG